MPSVSSGSAMATRVFCPAPQRQQAVPRRDGRAPVQGFARDAQVGEIGGHRHPKLGGQELRDAARIQHPLLDEHLQQARRRRGIVDVRRHQGTPRLDLRRMQECAIQRELDDKIVRGGEGGGRRRAGAHRWRDHRRVTSARD